MKENTKNSLVSLGKLIHKNPNTDSPIEEILYQEFMKYGVVPVPQFQVGAFYIDLAFPDLKIAIEADGHEWHSSLEQIARDKYRADKIAALGWRIERYTGTFIHKNSEAIVAKIMLQHFKEKMTPEQKLLALGRVVQFLTRDGNVKLAEQITESVMNGELS